MLVGGLVLGLFLLVVGTVAAWFAWRHFSADLPDISAVDDHRPAQTTTVLAADGSLLARWTDDRLIHRTVVPWEEIPQVMRDAMLAAEDADFYSHPGLDYRGLVRAAIRNIEAGATVQGASTITQQLVKNLVLSPERTYRRKIQELLLAFRLEERLSKDEILELYLNEVFFGRTAYGVEEAAHYYFGRGIATVSLPEAALLAAVVQSPNRLDPHRHPERALARRAYVLRQMWEKGFIEESVYRAADEAPIVLAGPEDRPPRLDRHPWVVDAARRELLVLAEEVPELAGRNWMAEGLRIHTTVDPELQDAAEAAVVAGLQAFDERRGFLRPFRMLDAEGAERWGREQHADVMRAGLDADEAYRAVIVRSDSEATVVRMGGVDATLVRAPESRMRPDASREWAEVLPVHAVFTVQPVRSWTPDALASASPEDLLVRFRPSAQAALIAMDVDERAIRAIVGGFDFRESSFHRAVQARRQTGSAFKTFVFAAGLDARLFSPATLYVDQPFTQAMDVGPDWRPRNHDGRYEGEMSARRALARSRNTVTAQILRQVGVDAAQRMAREAGIAVQLPEGLALALGAAEMSPMELTTAYATLAAGGVHAQPGIISRIEDSEGNVLFQREVIREQRIAPDTAWLTTSMLRSVVTEGTGSQARRLPFETAGKTGTTNQVRDAWYVGYSTRLVTGVWVGRDSFDPLGRGEGGGRTALPIWVDFMAAAHADDPPPGFPEPPPGVRVVRVDEATGLRARAGASGARDEFFLEGTVPLDMAPVDEERSVEDTLLRGSIFGFDEDQEDGSGAEGAPSHGF
ncbi:MAG: PBP1A family penicillin-binding protein [Deltaproteobacteria bacterium]|nr:MAG: PBP1A family penicillin-binding protein [Deltaproteobacteria bacterium]